MVVSLNATVIKFGLAAEIDPLEGEKFRDPVGSEAAHTTNPPEVEIVTFWFGGVGLPAVTEKVRVLGATMTVCAWHSDARQIPDRIPSADRSARDRFLFI